MQDLRYFNPCPSNSLCKLGLTDSLYSMRPDVQSQHSGGGQIQASPAGMGPGPGAGVQPHYK